MSQRELAQKHGVSLSTLQKRALREKWADRRQRHCTKVVAKAEEKRAVKKAEKIVRLQECADRMQAHIDRVLADEKQFHRYLIDFGKNEVIHKKADTKAIRDMTAALKDLTEMIRDVYGLPNAVDKNAIKMAREKLKLDKQRAASGLPDAGETGVVMLPPVMAPEAPPEGDEPDG